MDQVAIKKQMMNIKFTKTLLLTVACLCMFASRGQSTATLLNKQINVPAKQIRIDALMEQFATQTGLEFSFNSRRINSSRKITVINQKNSLRQWLKQLDNSFNIIYRISGNHIILFDKQTPKSNPVTSTPGRNVLQSKQPVSIAKPENKLPAVSPVTDLQTEQKPVTPSDSLTINNKGTVTKPLVQNVPGANVNTENKKVRAEKDDDADVVNSGESIEIVSGYSKHGSGDMDGIIFGTQYIRDLSKRFSLKYSLRSSINSQKHEILVNNTITGTVDDNSIRFTTAGVQLGVTGVWNFVNTGKHKIGLGLGAFGRYQSASHGSDGYAVYNPTTTLPVATIQLFNTTPQHTYSAGGIFEFNYSFHFTKKLYLGTTAGFQTDTQGDVILQAGLVFGRTL